MVEDINKTGTVIDILRGQDAATAQKKEPERKDVVQREDFLQILVTQLQNQDPLDPMSNDQFAVDLAQFSQLEQLVNLNEKFDQAQNSDVGSLAQYLGRRVAVSSTQINLSALDSEKIEMRLTSPSEVAIELTDANGEVVSRLPMGSFGEGTHTLDISEATTLSGKYGFKVLAVGSAGSEAPVESYLLGNVTGFVPGPNGSLLVGDREVSMQDVVVVRE